MPARLAQQHRNLKIIKRSVRIAMLENPIRMVKIAYRADTDRRVKRVDHVMIVLLDFRQLKEIIPVQNAALGCSQLVEV